MEKYVLFRFCIENGGSVFATAINNRLAVLLIAVVLLKRLILPNLKSVFLHWNEKGTSAVQTHLSSIQPDINVNFPTVGHRRQLVV